MSQLNNEPREAFCRSGSPARDCTLIRIEQPGYRRPAAPASAAERTPSTHASSNIFLPLFPSQPQAIVVGNIALLVQNFDATAAKYRAQADSIRSTAKYLELSSDMQDRIHEYFLFMQARGAERFVVDRFACCCVRLSWVGGADRRAHKHHTCDTRLKRTHPAACSAGGVSPRVGWNDGAPKAT